MRPMSCIWRRTASCLVILRQSATASRSSSGSSMRASWSARSRVRAAPRSCSSCTCRLRRVLLIRFSSLIWSSIAGSCALAGPLKFRCFGGGAREPPAGKPPRTCPTRPPPRRFPSIAPRSNRPRCARWSSPAPAGRATRRPNPRPPSASPSPCGWARSRPSSTTATRRSRSPCISASAAATRAPRTFPPTRSRERSTPPAPSRAIPRPTRPPACPTRRGSTAARPRGWTCSIRGACRWRTPSRSPARRRTRRAPWIARITNSEGATVSSWDADFVFANSLGFVGGFPSSRASIGCGVLASDGEAMQRDYWYTSERDPARLEARGGRGAPRRRARGAPPGSAARRHRRGARSLRGEHRGLAHRPLRERRQRRRASTAAPRSSSTRRASRSSPRS